MLSHKNLVFGSNSELQTGSNVNQWVASHLLATSGKKKTHKILAQHKAVRILSSTDMTLFQSYLLLFQTFSFTLKSSNELKFVETTGC